MPYQTREAREVAGIIDSLSEGERRWLRDLIFRVLGLSQGPEPDAPPPTAEHEARVIQFRPRRRLP